MRASAGSLGVAEAWAAGVGAADATGVSMMVGEVA